MKERYGVWLSVRQVPTEVSGERRSYSRAARQLGC